MQNMQKTKQYVGLDVHKKFVYGVIEDEKGNVLFQKKFKTQPEDMDWFLLNVRKDEAIIALESCVCWQYVYDYLNDAGYRLKLAHPPAVSDIKKMKRKTDKTDAKLLADLLRSHMLPEAYPAPPDIRIKRQITRHRASLTDIQTEVKNKIHAILMRHGLESPLSDAFCKSGIVYLRSLDLPGCDRHELDQYLDIIEVLDKQIEETNDPIERIANNDPAIRLAETMPGIGHYAATSFLGEVGDIRRFKSADHLASFAGLTPRVYQSGNKCRLGGISKQGSRHLRWIMIQAANVAVQHDHYLRRIYRRLALVKGHGKAVTAVARRMVTYLYAMLMNNIPYHALQIHKATT